MNAALALLRSPREGAERVVREGRLSTALALVLVATALSLAHTLRFAGEVTVQDVMFGERRSPLIGTLLETLGRDMTAVVLYLFESAWAALLVVSALAPILLWLLGATAIHAAARMSSFRRQFAPTLIALGYATAVTRPIADLPAIVLGPRGPLSGLVSALGALALVWLGVIAWHLIRALYGVPAERATTILVIAVVLFYLVPVTLILVAIIAILVSAIVLEYVPAR